MRKTLAVILIAIALIAFRLWFVRLVLNSGLPLWLKFFLLR